MARTKQAARRGGRSAGRAQRPPRLPHSPVQGLAQIIPGTASAPPVLPESEEFYERWNDLELKIDHPPLLRDGLGMEDAVFRRLTKMTSQLISPTGMPLGRVKLKKAIRRFAQQIQVDPNLAEIRSYLARSPTLPQSSRFFELALRWWIRTSHQLLGTRKFYRSQLRRQREVLQSRGRTPDTPDESSSDEHIDDGDGAESEDKDRQPGYTKSEDDTIPHRDDFSEDSEVTMRASESGDDFIKAEQQSTPLRSSSDPILRRLYQYFEKPQQQYGMPVDSPNEPVGPRIKETQSENTFGQSHTTMCFQTRSQ